MAKENDELYFTILEYLSKYGINEETNISDLFKDYLLNPKEVGDMLFGQERIDRIKDFLDIIRANGHLAYTIHPVPEEIYRDENSMRVYKWLKSINITAKILNSGLDYYYAHLLRKATIRSFKNQFWYNLITWCIALLAVGTTIYTIIQNTDLNQKVKDLNTEVQQLKSQQHSQVINGKNLIPIKK